jgi:nitroreductase
VHRRRASLPEPLRRREDAVPLVKQIEERRAYRALDSSPIAEEVLLRLAQAAHLAPSSSNNQPWRIVTVVEPARLGELKESLSKGNYWARKAPAIAAFASKAEWSSRIDGGRDLAWFELGMAAMAYQIQAVEEGLRVHPIIGFDAEAAKRAIGLPQDVTLEVLVVLGYPGDRSGLSEKHLASESSARKRKDLEEVAAFDSWNDRLIPAAKA